VPCRRSHSSLCLHGADLLLFGGEDGASCLNDLWSFDLENESWNRLQGVDGFFFFFLFFNY
jgi:hypothetical protein